MDKLGFDLSKYQYPEKEKLLRNCVDPEIGLAILERVVESNKIKYYEQQSLF